MVLFERKNSEMRGEIGVGLFLSDPRVQAIMVRLGTERPGVMPGEAMMLVFWNEKAIRDDVHERAELVARAMIAYREVTTPTIEQYVAVENDLNARYVRALAAVHNWERQPMPAPVASWDGVSMVGFDTRPANAPTRLEAGETFAWTSPIGGHGLVAKATPDPGAPVLLNDQEENDWEWSRLRSGVALERIGDRYAVYRDEYMNESDAAYRERIQKAILARARLGLLA